MIIRKKKMLLKLGAGLKGPESKRPGVPNPVAQSANV